MDNKKHGESASFVRMMTISFTAIGCMLVALIVLLICHCVWPERFTANRDIVVEDIGIASGAEIAKEATEDQPHGPAIINDAAEDELAEAEADYLSVVWVEDGELHSADSRQEAILIAPSNAYNFKLAVKISETAATNVRAFVRTPKVLLSDRPAYVEVLLVADNALPYYARLALMLDDSMVEAADDEEGTPISCMLFRYREDSAILHSNSLVDGQVLDEYALFDSETGVLLGAQAMDGEIPAGETGYCVISWTMQSDTIDATTYTHTTTPVNEAIAESTWLKNRYDTEYQEQQPKG